jgi:hypothetical protein
VWAPGDDESAGREAVLALRHDRLAWVEALGDQRLPSEPLGHLHRADDDLVVGADDVNEFALRAELHGIRRNGQGALGHGECQLDVDERARPEAAPKVREQRLEFHRAGLRVGLVVDQEQSSGVERAGAGLVVGDGLHRPFREGVLDLGDVGGRQGE